MEALGVAVNIITVIELTGTVTTLCCGYLSKVKSARRDIHQLLKELANFQVVLMSVEDLALSMDSQDYSGAPESHPPAITLLGGLLADCEKELKRLQEKLQRKQGRPTFVGSVLWPLKEGEVLKTVEIFERAKSTIMTALSADQMSLTAVIHDDLIELSNRQAQTISDEKQEKILKWLAAPDPFTNHNLASQLCHKGTGTWFIDGPEFLQWKQEPHSFIWLHGMSGCGKSVLCSTVIDCVARHSHLDPTCVYAYFYFDFRDPEKQLCDKMLCSLINQLCTQGYCKATSDSLNKLYAKKQEGRQQAQIIDLLATLKEILGQFQHAYIIIDALDECMDRENLWPLLESLKDHEVVQPHIMVTSRRERDIEENLDSLTISQILIASDIIAPDIQLYIERRLHNEPKLKRWPQSKLDHIQVTLTERADGMFRWVACQLDQLCTCLTLSAIEKALQKLPRTLHDTYTRILLGIDEIYRVETQKVLQWLAFSAHAEVTLAEIVEVLATELENDLQFVPENRLHDPLDLLAICSSLIAIVTTPGKYYPYEPRTLVKLAHASVKEFLVSHQSQNFLPFSYHFTATMANKFITKTCIVYLLQFDTSDCLNYKIVKDHPLAEYAAQYWGTHAQVDKGGFDSEIQGLAMKLFQQSELFLNWIRLHNPDSKRGPMNLDISGGDVAPPLYYSALLGLSEITEKLLLQGADVNTQGGQYENALQVASHYGHVKVVELLIDNGATVNKQSATIGNALQAASDGGHLAVVALLIMKGALINVQGGHYGSALQAASHGGHTEVVKLLLEKGADVNAKGGLYGNSLQAASAKGHIAVMQCLIDNGANVNAPGGQHGNTFAPDLQCGNALQAASLYGHVTIGKQLIERGADVNAHGGYYGNALQAASFQGHMKVVEMLFQKGADINVQCGHYGSPLQAASAGGHTTVVKFLLEKGAHANAQSGWYGDALSAASGTGQTEIAELLIEKGADVNAQHQGVYGDALQIASAQGHLAVVRLLFEKGADVNAKGFWYGAALHPASYEGHIEIVKLLIEKGADVNAQGGVFDNALHAANMKLLMAKGFNFNPNILLDESSPQTVAVNRWTAIVELLLEKGAV